jgi:SAM-dependent methyltransferase
MNPLYEDGAEVYDLVHGNKDYGEEAEGLHETIQDYKRCSGNQLLDAGCGTGTHIKYLSDWYDCTGFDISEELIAVAQNKVTEGSFRQADMKDFEFDEDFDIITCMFNSICCATNTDELYQILDAFSAHLRPGGVVVIEKSQGGLVEDEDGSGSSVDAFDSDGVKVTRAKTWERQGKVLHQETAFHIIRDGNIEQYRDSQVSGIFTDDDIINAIEQAGLEAACDESGPGRGVFIGVSMI